MIICRYSTDNFIEHIRRKLTYHEIKYLNEKYGISERVAEQMVEGYRK